MKKHVVLGALALVLAIMFWGCSDDDDAVTNPGVDPPIADTATCLGCHASESHLKASLGSSSAPPIRLVAAGDG
jgi:hypothetical protein